MHITESCCLHLQTQNNSSHIEGPTISHMLLNGLQYYVHLNQRSLYYTDAEFRKNKKYIDKVMEQSPRSRETTEEEETRELVQRAPTLFAAVKAYMLHVFTPEYIMEHTCSGKKAKSGIDVKPQMDANVLNRMKKLIKEKWPETRDPDITVKVNTLRFKIAHK